MPRGHTHTYTHTNTPTHTQKGRLVGLLDGYAKSTHPHTHTHTGGLLAVHKDLSNAESRSLCEESRHAVDLLKIRKTVCVYGCVCVCVCVCVWVGGWVGADVRGCLRVAGVCVGVAQVCASAATHTGHTHTEIHTHHTVA